jgi:hypothetical protein
MEPKSHWQVEAEEFDVPPGKMAVSFDGQSSGARQLWRQIVSNDVQSAPPLVYEGLDPAMEPKSSTAEVSDAVKEAIRTIKSAMATARRPGMPLSILSNVAREAPLGSLLIAFLLGIAVARRARR